MVDETKISVVIPMKLNNERLPDKSFLSLNGLALCEHTFNRCVDFKLKNLDKNIEIYCYCSDDKICDWLPNPHITYVERSPSLDSNDTSMNDVLKSFSKIIKSDIYVVQFITAPFLKWTTLQEALNIMMLSHMESIHSVKRIKSFVNFKNKPLNYSYDNYPRTQDLKEILVDTSSFYIFRHNVLENNRRVGDDHCCYFLNDLESIDIDTREDYEFSKLIKI